MALVNFKRGTKPADVSSLNADTIYFFTDTKEIYLGSVPYAGDLTDLEGDIEELQSKVGALESWKTTTDAAVKQNTSDLAQAKTDIIGIQGSISDIEGDIEELQEAGFITEAALEGYAKTSDVTTELGKKADKDTVTSLTGRVDKVEEDVATAQGAAEAAQSAAEAAQGDATKALADAKTAKDAADKAQGDIDGLKNALGDVHTKQDDQDAKIKALEDFVAGLGSEDETLEDILDEIKASIAKAITGLTAANNSVVIGGTDTAKTIKVAISEEDDNVLELKSDGLYVNVDGLPDTALTDYTVTVTEGTDSTNTYAKVYEIKQPGTNLDAKINIPKDMVVSSGQVVNNADDTHQGAWIKLVLNNDDVIWIAASDLVDTVTANNGEAPVVSITVTDGTKIGATLNNGTVTKAHLVAAVQTTLDHADETYEALTWGTV